LLINKVESDIINVMLRRSY